MVSLNDENKDRYMVAIHEAGHCVICYLLGYKFDKALICLGSGSNSDGKFIRLKSQLNDPKPKDQLGYYEYIKDLVRIILAGGAAVSIFNNSGEIRYLGIEPDLIQAVNLLKIITDSDSEIKSYLHNLGHEDFLLLHKVENRRAVDFLAKKLLEEDVILYEDIIEDLKSCYLN